MRKILRWTLGKKIFILILLCFSLIQVLNVTLDFHREKSHVYSKINNMYNVNEMCEQLSVLYSQKYDELNPSFYEEISQSLKTEDGYQIESFFVLNPDFEMVYNQREQNKTYLTLRNEYEEYITILIFDLSQISLDEQKQMENILREHVDDYFLTIDIASPTYDLVGNNVSMTIEDLSYLSINGQIFLDHRQNNEKIHTMHFESYESANCLLSAQGLYLDEYDDSHEDNYQKHDAFIRDCVSSMFPQQGETFSSGISSFEEKEGTLYSIHSIPLISKNAKPVEADMYEEYDVQDVDGYLVFYTHELNAISRITHQVIYSKMIIYIISFIVCIMISLLISYILTRRIKKINQCTLAIANNDFDIHLNEKSKDELGVLSHNINQMSQQLKTTIQQLNDEIEYVKKLEGMRKEFIANFTHEIKTPLSIINGYIELIEAGKDDLKKQQYLSAIHQEIEHINQLIMAMLDLSRLESGKVELHKEDIDLEDLLMSIVETFAPILKKKHIHVVMGDEFPHIQGDFKELKIVFQNFMSNAIKHTPQNGHIYIKYHQGILSFENEGKPLSHEQKEKIWDTYVSSDRQGTGLGLAICRSILELHGFQYDVCNSEKGVEFQIHIL